MNAAGRCCRARLSSGKVITVITLPNGLQINLRRSVDELMAQYGTTLATQLRS